MLGSLQDTFLLIRAYLAYVFLEISLVGVDADYSSAFYKVEGYRTLPVSDAESRFPPLAFVAYEDTLVLKGKMAVLNRSHRFARWLLSVAPELAERFPAIFRLISSELLEKGCREWNPENSLRSVNAGLQRLMQLAPKLAPGEEGFLTKDDFGV